MRVCCRRCIKITETTEKGLRSCPIMLNTGRGDLCWSRTRCRQDSYTIVPAGGANNHLCAIKFGISEAGVRGGIEIRGLRFPVVAPHLGQAKCGISAAEFLTENLHHNTSFKNICFFPLCLNLHHPPEYVFKKTSAFLSFCLKETTCLYV